VYRLKGILHFMRSDGLSLDEAHDRIANWNHIAQAAGAAN
jgi:hypothetical protein